MATATLNRQQHIATADQAVAALLSSVGKLSSGGMTLEVLAGLHAFRRASLRFDLDLSRHEAQVADMELDIDRQNAAAELNQRRDDEDDARAERLEREASDHAMLARMSHVGLDDYIDHYEMRRYA